MVMAKSDRVKKVTEIIHRVTEEVVKEEGEEEEEGEQVLKVLEPPISLQNLAPAP